MEYATRRPAACRTVELNTLTDDRGSLTVAEAELEIPFAIQRVFYVHGVPAGAIRACHAHRQQEQVILPVAGSFEVIVDDGTTSSRLVLADPGRGLYVPPMIWTELRDFSAGAVCAVLASMPYRDDDYWRDYDEFRQEAVRLAGGVP